jgi:hypothetical protein
MIRPERFQDAGEGRLRAGPRYVVPELSAVVLANLFGQLVGVGFEPP